MISVYLRSFDPAIEQFSDELIYYGDDRLVAQSEIERLYHPLLGEQIVWHEEGRKCVSGMKPLLEG